MAEPQFTSAELESEEWRPVAGYEGRYSISNLGHLRGDDSPNGNRFKAGRQIHPATKKGYKRVGLSYPRCRQRKFFVHVLVAEAFLAPRPAGKQVNHKDGNKANNRAGNLEWVTQGENNIHARRVLGEQVGEKHKWSSLTNAQVSEIKRMFRENPKTDAYVVARMFGVGHGAIYKIKYNKAWRTVA